MDQKCFDELVTVKDEDAISTSKQLAQKEGIFVGISAGATFNAALQVARNAPKGSTVLAMLPDTAERYLSTVLFADISPESDVIEDEITNIDFQKLDISKPGQKDVKPKGNCRFCDDCH